MATDSIPDRSPQIIAAATTTWCLAVICVGLRFLCRKLIGNKLGLDDWLILLSLLWAGTHTFTVVIYQIPQGFGKHIEYALPDASFSWAVGLFVGEVVYALSLVFTKWSILAFYWRIFSTLTSTKILIWILFGIVCAWGIANIFVIIFQCVPVQAFWARFHIINPMPPSEYHCGIDDRKFFSGSSIPNIITDILLIALPLPYITRIRLPIAQKIGLAGIFLISAFIVVISVVRFIFILHMDLASPDITWTIVDATIWSLLEENLAIVCACLPSLRPLLDLVLHRTVLGGSERTASRHSRSELRRGSTGISGARYNTVESELGTIRKNRTPEVDD